jgi:hypothetical protein
LFHKGLVLIRLKKFDVSLRTAYAQGKELALAQKEVPLWTAGSVQVEKRAGGQFVYRYRYDATGKRAAEYLGPHSDERTMARVERVREEMRDQATLAAYSQTLRKIGFYSVDNSTVLSVAALFNAGIFGKGAVLIGTHAFGVLLNELGVSASPFPLTEDVDVARARRIEIAALPDGGLLTLLKQTGLPFHEVPGLKRGEPSTSFKVRGRKLKIDLLVPANRMPYRAIRVPELGAYATGLPYLAYLLDDPVMSILIGRDRLVPVTVPHAGRFLIHKLAVSTLRAASDSPKREKDILQSATLAATIAQDQDFVLQEAIDAINVPLRKRVKPAVRRTLKLLQSDYPAAVQLLEKLA